MEDEEEFGYRVTGSPDEAVTDRLITGLRYISKVRTLMPIDEVRYRCDKGLESALNCRKKRIIPVRITVHLMEDVNDFS